jgi:hypothetical protein
MISTINARSVLQFSSFRRKKNYYFPFMSKNISRPVCCFLQVPRCLKDFAQAQPLDVMVTGCSNLVRSAFKGLSPIIQPTKRLTSRSKVLEKLTEHSFSQEISHILCYPKFLSSTTLILDKTLKWKKPLHCMAQYSITAVLHMNLMMNTYGRNV